VADVMREWKAGTLHSGKDGEVVKGKDQAVAIALSMCGAGKEKVKSYQEYANNLLSEVKANCGKSCDCAKCKKGTKEYAECNCGCAKCKKRVAMSIGYPTPTFSEEDTRMALAQLRKIKSDTSSLIVMTEQIMMQGEMPEIEAWMESKITLAADYMASVHDYLVYGPGPEIEERENDEEYKAYKEDEGLEKACWPGYEAVGMKKKGGKMVPNCVPVGKNQGKK